MQALGSRTSTPPSHVDIPTFVHNLVVLDTTQIQVYIHSHRSI